MKMKNAGHLLGDLSKLFLQRNKLYKDNYKRFGDTLLSQFPDGIKLKTRADFNRFALFLQLQHKMSRYAHAILTGGHADSLDDIAVYSMLTQEYDNDQRAAKTKSNRPRKSQRRSSRRTR